MELLDRALATAYVSKYPEEAKRVHLGKDDEVIDAETEYGSVKKRQPKQKKVVKPIVKPTPKKATPAKKKVLPKKKVVVEKKKKPAAILNKVLKIHKFRENRPRLASLEQ